MLGRTITALVLSGAPLLAQGPAAAPTADEIVVKYVEKIGGIAKIEAVKTLKRSGKFRGGGGFEAKFVELNKRPDLVREEITYQGLTGVNAFDGKTGWKIDPFQGKKDPEPLGEDELKDIIEDSVFDGQLVHYREKGNTIEFGGTEPVEGSDTWKLKVTLKNGDVSYYYIDTEDFVPIKIEYKRMIRGAEQVLDVFPGDYKAVDGWYVPHSYEQGRPGSSQRSSFVFERIEANVPLDDSLFAKPAGPA
ncbi:MAG TPA: outer membrane lipoprotein-sorting protein, partial [Thermoanaerobaculia bacterium]|nr:outer membrane lipoprotein-sorting protein [Thermoanaerobaculia bacterium]